MLKNNNLKPIQAAGKFNKKLVYWIGLLVLVVWHIVVSLQTVAYGSELSMLESQKSEIEKENRLLSLEIVESTSLIKLSQKSEEFGFNNPLKTLYLAQDEEVAILRESGVR